MNTSKAYGGNIYFLQGKKTNKQSSLSVSGNIPGGETVTPDKAGSLGSYMKHHDIKS